MKRVYGFSCYNVMLDADDSLPNNWIDNYLMPFFCAEPSKDHDGIADTPPTWRLHAVVTANEIAHLRNQYASYSSMGTIYSYPELATSFVETENGYLVRQSDPDTKVPESWLFIRPSTAEVNLYIEPENPESRYIVARVVRSIIIGQALADGWALLHASCVSIDNIGLLTVGNKGAGKTALMMALIKERQGKYVSNDKLLAKQISNNLVVQGLPHSPAVKLDMLERYGLENLRTDYVFQGTSSKRRFHVKELCEALGTSVASQTTIASILVPHFCINDNNGDAMLSPAQIEQLLEAVEIRSVCEFQPVWNHVFSINQDERNSWWKGVKTTQFVYDNHSIANIVREL